MQLKTNIVSQEQTLIIAEAVLKTLKNSLAKSLGPFGSTTIMQGRQTGTDIVSKDGFTILKSIRFDDAVAITFFNIIKDASQALVEEVGDGSTSAIIAAYYLYENLKGIMEYRTDIRPKYVLDQINEVIDMIIKKLDDMKTDITEDNIDDIISIATVSLNNNVVVGELIGNIYKEIGLEGFIKVKLGNTNKTTYEKTEGFQLDNGYYDKIFINDVNNECRLRNTAVLLFDASVMTEEETTLFTSILNAINGMGDPELVAKYKQYNSLLVIAPGFGEVFKKQITITNNFYNNNKVRKNYCIIQHALATDMSKELLYDLSIMTGADIIKNSLQVVVNVNDIDKYLGYSEEVSINNKYASFTGHQNTNEESLAIIKKSILDELKGMMDEHIYDAARSYELKKRLAILNKNLVTIYVGGNSEQERATNKHLIDDAVAACKSALTHGYVIGGNLSIIITCNELIKDLEKAIVASPLEESANIKNLKFQQDLLRHFAFSFKSVYKEVLYKSALTDEEIEKTIEYSIENKVVYDLTKNEFSTDKIINSVKTEKEILKNVVSIIVLIITSNQFIELYTNTPIGNINRDVYQIED